MWKALNHTRLMQTSVFSSLPILSPAATPLLGAGGSDLLDLSLSEPDSTQHSLCLGRFVLLLLSYKCSQVSSVSADFYVKAFYEGEPFKHQFCVFGTIITHFLQMH